MSLYKIKDFDPEYSKHFEDGDVIGMDLYDAGNDKIGSVDDIMVDDNGNIRYLLVNTGMWVAGKRVLLPIGRARIDYTQKRVYAGTLTKSQVEALPELTEETNVDDDHEERVRGVYRSSTTPEFQQQTPHTTGVGYTGAESYPASTHSEPMLDLDTPYVDGQIEVERQAAPVPTPAPVPAPMPVATAPTVDRDADMYALDDRNHPSFKLYQERLVASKTRQKTGEAVISKHIETETATASVPVQKERVVIERVPSTGVTAAAPGEVAFKDGEVSRVEVYEEVPEFRKEAFVREEVKVSKVVEHETATTQEQLRREELDIKNAGDRPIVDNK